MEILVERIRHHHRSRCFLMKQKNRVHLSLAAFIRLDLGWSKELPDADRKRIEAQALKMAKGVDEGHELYDTVQAQLASKALFESAEDKHRKAMEKLARQMPAWKEWAESVRGFGECSLAVIIGEAGDLSNYSSHSKLWKRMGLAVMDGVRQGGLRSSATAEEWIEHGYSAKRRSAMFVIGDAILKAQIRKVKDADGNDTGERTCLGSYGEIYLARKAYERAKAPEGTIDIIIHRRAQRYMEKRLLRDLWKAWRRANFRMPERATMDLPSVYLIAAE